MSDIIPAEQSQSFDDIRRTDEHGEYWMARELMPLLEYKKWQDFHEAIQRAIEDCKKSGRSSEENFTQLRKISEGAGRPQIDYRLTAYACRLIVMAARTKGNVTAKARTYFSDKVGEAERIETEVLDLAGELGDNPLAEVARRIVLRQELTEANKRLIARAELAGVLTPKQRALFMDSGYRGLYGGERENDIHARKDLAPREKISSWMGAMETMANLLRAVVGEKRMERNNPQTPGQQRTLSGRQNRP